MIFLNRRKMSFDEMRVLVTGGGIIPENDSKELSKIGVGKLFGPGTPVKESLKYIEDWVQKNRR